MVRPITIGHPLLVVFGFVALGLYMTFVIAATPGVGSLLLRPAPVMLDEATTYDAQNSMWAARIGKPRSAGSGSGAGEPGTSSFTHTIDGPFIP
ncbi:MAG: hypothetical protein ACAI35_18490 [Candidatus Methylacidiphilales bacterium]